MSFVQLSSGGGGSSGVIAGALSGVDFSVITTEFISVIPVILPVALTFIAIRKGLGFLFGTLRGV